MRCILRALRCARAAFCARCVLCVLRSAVHCVLCYAFEQKAREAFQLFSHSILNLYMVGLCTVGQVSDKYYINIIDHIKTFDKFFSYHYEKEEKRCTSFKIRFQW